MGNLISDFAASGFYTLLITLSVIIVTLSMLLRVFGKYAEASLLSKTSVGVAMLAFAVSFWLKDIEDPRGKMFVTSVLSIFLLWLIYSKNSDKHLEHLDSAQKKIWIMFLSIIYAILANSLIAFLPPIG